MIKVLMMHLNTSNKLSWNQTAEDKTATVLQAKSDNDIMFCLQSYQGLQIDRSLVY